MFGILLSILFLQLEQVEYRSLPDTLILPSSGFTSMRVEKVRVGGDITIKSTPEDSVFIIYHKYTRAWDRENAEHFATLLANEIDKKRGTILVRGNAPKNAPWAGTPFAALMHYSIRVPYYFKVEVKNALGSVTAEGPFPVVKILNSHGEVDVSHVKERLELENSFQSVSLTDVKGIINVKTSHGPIIAHNISGNRIDLVTSYSSIETVFDEILPGKVRLTTSYGPIDIELPDTSSTRIVARTEKGNIYSDFPKHVQIPEYFEAVLSKGDALFELETCYKPINIRKK